MNQNIHFTRRALSDLRKWIQNIYYQQVWDVIFKSPFMSFILILFLYQELHSFTSKRKELERRGKEGEEDENKVEHNFENFRI